MARILHFGGCCDGPARSTSLRDADLRLVLSAVRTEGLESLHSAVKADRVIRGKLVDDLHRGCLMFFMSEQYARSRDTLRTDWSDSNPLFTDEHRAAVRRIITGWDAAKPDQVPTGDDYRAAYGAAQYVIDAPDLRRALLPILRARRQANRAERHAQGLRQTGRGPTFISYVVDDAVVRDMGRRAAKATAIALRERERRRQFMMPSIASNANVGGARLLKEAEEQRRRYITAEEARELLATS